MAKLKLVKCRICGKMIDRSVEKYVDHSPWFAHEECYNKREQEKSQEEKDLEALMQYCKELYGKDFDYARTLRLAKSYHEKMELTYTGMQKTLEYVYKVKHLSLEKGKGSIGIVPSLYGEALRYYFSIWEANQNTQPKILEPYEPKTVEIVIPIPQRPKAAIKKFFKMLEEDEDE